MGIFFEKPCMVKFTSYCKLCINVSTSQPSDPLKAKHGKGEENLIKALLSLLILDSLYHKSILIHENIFMYAFRRSPPNAPSGVCRASDAEEAHDCAV